MQIPQCLYQRRDYKDHQGLSSPDHRREERNDHSARIDDQFCAAAHSIAEQYREGNGHGLNDADTDIDGD